MDLITTLMEQDVPGFEVQSGFVREYNTTYASHILGYVGMMSGAQLELSVFKNPAVILIGVVFIVVRCIGKYFGSYIPSLALKLDPNVRKHLGITLFPQAGVALGMVVSAQALGEANGSVIRNIILFAVLIYELFGPLLTKQSLQKAGEIAPAHSEAENRARFTKKKKA